MGASKWDRGKREKERAREFMWGNFYFGENKKKNRREEKLCVYLRGEIVAAMGWMDESSARRSSSCSQQQQKHQQQQWEGERESAQHNTQHRSTQWWSTRSIEAKKVHSTFFSSSLCLDGVKDFSILSSSNSNASKNSFLSSLSLSALHHHSSSQYVLFTIVGLSWLLNGRAEQWREQRGVLFVEYHEFKNWNCSSLHHHRRRVLCTMKTTTTTTTRNDEKIIFLVFDVFAALSWLCERSTEKEHEEEDGEDRPSKEGNSNYSRKDFFFVSPPIYII